MDFIQTPIAQAKQPPNLYRLGAIYGFLWGCVAIGILAIGMHSVGRELWRATPYYLLSSIPTGILVTKLLGRWLERAKRWMLTPFGMVALFVGTWVFASCMLAVNAVASFTLNLGTQNPFQAFTGIRLHDSLIMFFWYPLYGFGMIFPIFLAVWNCWDLRRRMKQTDAS